MSVTERSFYGYIETTRDSLLIFEACKRGLMPRVNRRLQEKERNLVQSGAVFCFDENESGIKRWTDGLVWSPSRILGNFLVYRELDKRLSPNDDMSRTGMQNLSARQRERALVGSLTSSYRFRKDGLIKKSMSLTFNGAQHHLVSYYTREDVLNQRLSTPSNVPELGTLEISPELLLHQNFRIPLFHTNTEVKKIPRSIEMTTPSIPRKESGFELNLERSTLRMKRRYTKNQRRTSDSRGLMQPDGCICGELPTPLILPPSPLLASPMAQPHPYHPQLHPHPYHHHHHHHLQPQSQPPQQQQPAPPQQQRRQLTPPSTEIIIRSTAPLTSTPSYPTIMTANAPIIPHASGSYKAPFFNDRQEQNPHQHYFSSTSFHAINHSTVSIMTNELAKNAFMADQSLLLGFGWNEFEMQM